MTQKTTRDVSGIYIIKNLYNDKIYIGQSKNIKKRWKSHIANSKNKKVKGVLYREMRIYGLENFEFDVLEYCRPSKLDEREIFWIKEYDTFENPAHYNKTAGGKNVSPKFLRKRRRKKKRK